MLKPSFGGYMIKRGCPVVTDGFGHEKKLHGTDAFPLACYEEDAGTHPVRPHWHDEFEVGYVTQGRVALDVGSQHRELCEGEGFLITSGCCMLSMRCPASRDV